MLSVTLLSAIVHSLPYQYAFVVTDVYHWLALVVIVIVGQDALGAIFVPVNFRRDDTNNGDVVNIS
jgi:hypothetical protein